MWQAERCACGKKWRSRLQFVGFQLSSSLNLKEMGLIVSKLWLVQVVLFIAAEKFLSLWRRRKVLVAFFLLAFGLFSASPLHKFFGQ